MSHLQKCAPLILHGPIALLVALCLSGCCFPDPWATPPPPPDAGLFRWDASSTSALRLAPGAHRFQHRIAVVLTEEGASCLHLAAREYWPSSISIGGEAPVRHLVLERADGSYRVEIPVPETGSVDVANSDPLNGCGSGCSLEFLATAEVEAQPEVTSFTVATWLEMFTEPDCPAALDWLTVTIGPAEPLSADAGVPGTDGG